MEGTEEPPWSTDVGLTLREELLLYHNGTSTFPSQEPRLQPLGSPDSLSHTQEGSKVTNLTHLRKSSDKPPFPCLQEISTPHWSRKDISPMYYLKSFNFPFKHTILLNFEQLRIALNYKYVVFEINMNPTMTYFLLCSDLAHVKSLTVFTKKPLAGL